MYIITVLTMVNSYIVIPALSTLGLGGVAYIVEKIYSSRDTDDTNVTRKVFKLLPHALWRVFVTALWTWLLLVLVSIAHFLLAILLCTITGSNDEYSLVLAMLPWILSALFICFILAFSRVIAVLEPGRYGKEALVRSAKMVRVGGAGTILAVYFSLSWLFAVFGYYPSTITGTMKPGWIVYAVSVVSAVCISFLNLYFCVVVVVMYYVYTSRFAADVSGLPKFYASEEHPYQPLADEAPPVSCCLCKYSIGSFFVEL